MTFVRFYFCANIAYTPPAIEDNPIRVYVKDVVMEYKAFLISWVSKPL
jgi:hypothetical protein